MLRPSYIVIVTIIAILLILLVIGIVVWLVVFETPKTTKTLDTNTSSASLTSTTTATIAISTTVIITSATSSTVTTKTTRRTSDNLCRNGGIYLYEAKKCVCKDGIFSGELCEIVANCDEIPEDSAECESLAELDLDHDVFAGACPRTVYC